MRKSNLEFNCPICNQNCLVEFDEAESLVVICSQCNMNNENSQFEMRLFISPNDETVEVDSLLFYKKINTIHFIISYLASPSDKYELLITFDDENRSLKKTVPVEGNIKRINATQNNLAQQLNPIISYCFKLIKLQGFL